jgi:hypothetical protein
VVVSTTSLVGEAGHAEPGEGGQGGLHMAAGSARIEQTSGADLEAKQLASTIDTSQTVQISQMRQMLSTLSPTHS